MNAAANSTIRGFYYQFNKTLFEVLKTEDNATVIPEGLVEDVDVITDDTYKAIQCKYHETSGKYEESILYQPILEMMLSYYYYENNSHHNIEYVLYIHLADNKTDVVIDNNFITRMLNSKNKDLIIKYVCRILDVQDAAILTLIEKPKRTEEDKKQINQYILKNNGLLASKVDISTFLSKFTLCFGESYSELESEVKSLMCSLDMSEDEVDKFFYPNAINIIAENSQKRNPEERKIVKDIFLDRIRKDKNILITKWTRKLASYNKLLKYKKDQLSVNLQIATRKRTFILSPPNTTNSEYLLSNFIGDYLQLYKRKSTQTSIPMFFIEGCSEEFINMMEKCLFERGILVNNGKVGNEINEAKLFDIANYGGNIKLALCRYDINIKDMIIRHPPDDVFIFGKADKDEFENRFSVEKLDVESFNELSYLLNLRKAV